MDEKAKILIIDDDEGMRETLSDILEEDTYLVTSAGSATRALEAISKDFYNLALIDIKLPDMSGMELLKKLKNTSPDTAAILVTGYASIETSIQALNLGAEAYIVKPLNIQEVKMSIARTLDRQKLMLENRRLFEELKESNEKLKREMSKKEALRSKLIQSQKLSGLGKLAGGISHEINNPLCAILGRTQLLLERSSSDDKVRDGLRVIEHESKRIARILENLDVFSRPSVDGLQELDVHETIDKTLSLIQTESGISNIRIHKSFDPSALRVMADENGLMHVFMNLIRNARDAMPGGGRLEISTSVEPENGSVHIVFSDNGEGIREENLEHVFEPFFTTRDPGEGTGLGLSIAYETVRRIGGDISITSEEGNGTVVTVTLPANVEREKHSLEKIGKMGG